MSALFAIRCIGGKATRSLVIGDAAIPETPVTAAIEIHELFENFRTMADVIDHRCGPFKTESRMRVV